MPTFLTPNRHGYNVRFSPFIPNRLVVAASQFYGLAGGGSLYVLELDQNNGVIQQIDQKNWTDGLFDVAWSTSPNLVVTASGDGGLQLWNLAESQPGPERVYHEHKNETYSVDWSRLRPEPTFLSASWDESIKLWDINRPQSLNTYLGHTDLVFSATFSPLMANTFASASGDGTLKLWDMLASQKAVTTVKAHIDGEVLTCDWSHFDQNIVATGGSDGMIRGFDIRKLTKSIFELYGSDLAVRRIQFSPFAPYKIASASFDFTTRIWDPLSGSEPIETMTNHTEFAYGVHWNPLRENQMCDCGWDSVVNVFTPKSLVL